MNKYQSMHPVRNWFGYLGMFALLIITSGALYNITAGLLQAEGNTLLVGWILATIYIAHWYSNRRGLGQ